MNHGLLRAGMWFLTLVELAVGVVATLAPRVFYDYVPWVDLALTWRSRDTETLGTTRR